MKDITVQEKERLGALLQSMDETACNMGMAVALGIKLGNIAEREAGRREGRQALIREIEEKLNNGKMH